MVHLWNLRKRLKAEVPRQQYKLLLLIGNFGPVSIVENLTGPVKYLALTCDMIKNTDSTMDLPFMRLRSYPCPRIWGSVSDELKSIQTTRSLQTMIFMALTSLLFVRQTLSKSIPGMYSITTPRIGAFSWPGSIPETKLEVFPPKLRFNFVPDQCSTVAEGCKRAVLSLLDYWAIRPALCKKGIVVVF